LIALQEAEKAEKEQEQREFDIARGNPLLNAKDFGVKRRWDDDVVFKNQARGTEDKKPKEFVNDLLRSDFHKRFMVSLSTIDRYAELLTKPRVDMFVEKHS
jgi:protein CWC15